MDIEEIYKEIFNKTTKLNNCWNGDSIPSRKIRREIEYNFFHNDKIDFINKFAYFYALDNRIKARYNNILKILLRYFSWERETKLLSKIKQFLNCFDYEDTKSIILKKSEDFVNGKNCFEDNSSNGQGLKSHGNVQDKQNKQDSEILKDDEQTQIDKQIENNTLNEEITNVDDNDKNVDKSKQDLEFKDKNFAVIENKAEEVLNGLETKKQDKNLQKDFMLKNNSIKQDNVTREKIEIPKNDLLYTKNINSTSINENIGNNKQEIKENLNQSDNIQTKDSDTIAKQEDIFVDNKEQEDKTIFYEQLQNNIINKSLDNKQNDFVKTNDSINNYSDKNSQIEIVDKYKNYQQQENEIAGEEISKISEKDMQLIKDIMQEEINKQMDIAEEKGDVYKMPISIKEVINSKTFEKSEVQVNKTHNTVLKNNK